MSTRPLKNPRHEAFARAYVKGGVARHAYVAAGYSARLGNDPRQCYPADVCASQLLKFPQVKARIEGLQQAMARRADVTEESILDELEEARQTALGERQSAAMVSASVAKAKLVGLMVDRKEIGDAGEFKAMSEAELRQYIANAANGEDIEAETLPLPTYLAPTERH